MGGVDRAVKDGREAMVHLNIEAKEEREREEREREERERLEGEMAQREKEKEEREKEERERQLAPPPLSASVRLVVGGRDFQVRPHTRVCNHASHCNLSIPNFIFLSRVFITRSSVYPSA